MLLTPHTIIGLGIASILQNPALVAPVAFISHFLMDKVPHWDFYSNTTNEDGSRTSGWRLFAFVADFGIALSIAWFFIFKAVWLSNNPNLALSFFVGALFSNLPDAMEAPYIFKMKVYEHSKFLQKFTDIQRNCQTQAKLPWGLLTQVFFCAISLYLLKR